MINLEYENKKYCIPTSWEEIDLETYIRIEGYTEEALDYFKFISIVTGLELDIVNNLTLGQLETIIPRLSFIKTPPLLKRNPVFLHEKKKYVTHKNFDNMTASEWLDMENKLKDEVNAYKVLPQVLSVIVREKDGKSIVKYDSEENKFREKIFRKMPVITALSFAAFFFERRREIYEKYSELFGEEGEEESGNQIKVNWGWIGVIFQLSNGDITKISDILSLPITFILTYSLYQKDVDKMQKQEQKRMQKRK